MRLRADFLGAVEEVVDPLVDVEVDRRHVQHLHVVLAEGPPEAGGHSLELLLVLLERGEDARLARSGAVEQEVEAHEGLPAPRRPGDEGARPGAVAIGEQHVQCWDARRSPLARRGVSVTVEFGQAREHVDPVGPEAVGVAAREEARPAQLEHLDCPRGAIAAALGGQGDHRVRHGELRRPGHVLGGVLPHPEMGGGKRAGPAGQVVQEAAELLLARVRAQGAEGVDHHGTRSALSDQPVDPLQHRRQAPSVQAAPEILVEDRRAHRRRVEELQLLAVPDELVEGLGGGGHVDRRLLGRRVREHVLLDHHGLARARQADDEVHGVRRKTAAQNRVEARAPAAESGPSGGPAYRASRWFRAGRARW